MDSDLEAFNHKFFDLEAFGSQNIDRGVGQTSPCTAMLPLLSSHKISKTFRVLNFDFGSRNTVYESFIP